MTKAKAKVMDKGIEVLAGPFEAKEEAWDKQDELNPEGWSGLRTPKTAKGHNGKWYVIKDHVSKA